jgi:hypothetical protein
VVVTSSALAVPTLTIWDANVTTTVAAVSGIASYLNTAFDGQWSVVISTGETKPALGSALNPAMDLNVQATSLGAAAPLNNLHVSWSDNAFGPFNAQIQAQLSGHVVTGTGSTVLYNTYYDSANGPVSASGTIAGLQYTTSGLLAAPTYASVQSGVNINNSAFGLTELLTITSVPGGSYSLDASLNGIPDGGTTVMLLGAALSGLAILRRKMA